jgi:hypothetical protein
MVTMEENPSNPDPFASLRRTLEQLNQAWSASKLAETLNQTSSIPQLSALEIISAQNKQTIERLNASLKPLMNPVPRLPSVTPTRVPNVRPWQARHLEVLVDTRDATRQLAESTLEVARTQTAILDSQSAMVERLDSMLGEMRMTRYATLLVLILTAVLVAR